MSCLLIFTDLFAADEQSIDMTVYHEISINPVLRMLSPKESAVVTVRVFTKKPAMTENEIRALIRDIKLNKIDPNDYEFPLKPIETPVLNANVKLTASKGSLDLVQNNKDGTYTAKFTNSGEAGIVLIKVLVNGVKGRQAIGVTVLPDYKNKFFIAKSELGKKLFHDVNLSRPKGQACASCHDSATAFVDPDTEFPTSLGALGASTFGSRNAPTVRYAALIPERYTSDRITYGGLFWDGRAKNLIEQAKQPFLNPLEMNQPNLDAVVEQVSKAVYAQEFRDVFGEDAFINTEQAYDYIAKALAAFQQSSEMSPFTSKYDEVQRGEESFTEAEARGFKIFSGPLCAKCHTTPIDKGVELFSNFTYETIGSPANTSSKFIDKNPNFIDYGRGAITQLPRDTGKFRVPTLRNIAYTAPYFHNGRFSTLKEVIKFYSEGNTEAPESSNADEFYGDDVRFTDDEIEDLVSFFHTLTDKDILEKIQ